MKSSVLARIYKNGGQQSASLAVFQMVNGCAAQLSGQVLTFEGKTCSLGMAFTTSRSTFIPPHE